MTCPRERRELLQRRRGPQLNSILGFAQLLELSELSSEDRENVHYILGAGRHLLALINDVIDIARIESGELSLSIEPVPVAALIEETSQLMRPLAAERSITAQIPVIIISGDSAGGTINELLANGAVDFLVKPYDINKFLTTIDKHLP
jgi:signal transduction histidine kinase